jgi:hypothetical protein
MRTWGVIVAALAAVPLGGCTLVFAVVEPRSGSTIATVPGATTVNVPLVVDASTGVVAVTGTIVDAGGAQVAAVTLVNQGAAPASRHQNSNEWKATQTLPAGKYVFRAVGTAGQGSSPSTSRAEAGFEVVDGMARPAVVLSLGGPAGDIQVPRGGSTPLSLTVDQTATTGPVTLSASGLPMGVSLSPAAPMVPAGSGSSPLSASLVASATAAGQSSARLVARSAGAMDGVVTRTVRVVPQDGAITFRPAPFLTFAGPPTGTSADGAWRVTASRMGASRVWTLRIARTTNAGEALDVTMATWGISGGSSVGGLLFCPGSPTTTALVLSDDDEDPAPPANRPGVTYRAKVIRLGPTGAPEVTGTLDGLKYLNGVQPQLGFSGDCSIVGSWSISGTSAADRNVQFANGLVPGAGFGGWNFADGSPTAAPTFTARVTGGTLLLTGPNGQTSNATVP